MGDPMSTSQDLAARKSLALAQSDLARMQLSLAWSDIRNIVAPPATRDRSAGARRTAAFLVAIAMPFLGRTRFGRLLRFASFGLGAWRAIAKWRGR
jgi:hypothetical protein